MNMKTRLLLLALAAASLGLQAQSVRIVEKPAFGNRSREIFQIDRVELKPGATILHIRIPLSSTGNPVSVGSQTYIRAGANGEKRTVISAEGIALDTQFPVRPTSFSLTFPAIDPKTPRIDLIFGENPYDPKIFDIELIPVERPESPLKDIYRNAKPLTGTFRLPVLDTAAAVYCGKIEGYAPRYTLRMTLSFHTMTDKLGTKEIEIPIREDGTFSVRVPIQYPVMADRLLMLENWFGGDDFMPVYLEPGRTTVQSIDLRLLANNRIAGTGWRNQGDKAVVNYGELARVNDDLMRVRRKIGEPFFLADQNIWAEKVYGLSPEKFKELVLGISRARQDSIRTIRDLCPRALEIALKTEQSQAVCDLNSYQTCAMNADMIKNKIMLSDKKMPSMDDYEKPGSAYYDFMETYPFNDERMLVSHRAIEACSWFRTRKFLESLEGISRDSMPDPIDRSMLCLRAALKSKKAGDGKGIVFDLWRLSICKDCHLMGRPQPFTRPDFGHPAVYAILQQILAVPPDRR